MVNNPLHCRSLSRALGVLLCPRLIGHASIIDSGAVIRHPADAQPGENVGGQQGEYWRYTSMLGMAPDDEERRRSLAMAAEVRCDVCGAILENLMVGAESHSEDHIMDQLEGVPTEAPVETGDPLLDKVNAARKGCNKHYKDELLLRGYSVQRCAGNETAQGVELSDASAAGRTAENRSWCLSTTFKVTAENVNIYDSRFEAAYYACEQTVGHNGFEIATFLADVLENGSLLDTAITRACQEAARCGGQAERKRGAVPSKKSGETARKGRRKAKSRDDDESLSMWDLIEQDRQSSRARRRKRRKKQGGIHTEL